MEEKTNFRSTAFDAACQTIFIEQPEAIGVAFKFLDCGCSRLCGVSAQGDPLGELVHVSGQPAHWPGDESELPDKELRLAIGRNVFGPGYIEPDA
jgi:hypothetical protein